jgi:hypothetical protein
MTYTIIERLPGGETPFGPSHFSLKHKDLNLDQMISKSRRLDRARVDHTVILYADGVEVDRMDYRYKEGV